VKNSKKDWRIVADEIEDILGAARGTVPISRRIDHAAGSAELVVRAGVDPNILPKRLSGYRVVVEGPERISVKKKLL
jgi:hypothetical protein